MKLGHRYLRCGVVVLSGVYMEGSLGTVASPSGAEMNGNPAIFRAVLHDFRPANAASQTSTPSLCWSFL